MLRSTAIRVATPAVLARGKARSSQYETVRQTPAAPGLTFLQGQKVSGKTSAYLGAEVREFNVWLGSASVHDLSYETLDRLLSECLDDVFFAGYNHERGDKLIAGVQFVRPELSGRGAAAFPRSRAALRGFRRLAHGMSRRPLPQAAVWTILAVACHHDDTEFALALFLAWDTMLRLPSDLISLTGKGLVPPASDSPTSRWALLLYPEEGLRRSKVHGHDEGVLVRHSAFRMLGSQLRVLKRRAGPTGKVWSFAEAEFCRRFTMYAVEAGLSAEVVPYQVRHGSASHASAVEGMALTEIQERLRHATAQSSLRYAKHARYQAEVADLPQEILRCAREVDAELVPLLLGKTKVRLPQFALPPPKRRMG